MDVVDSHYDKYLHSIPDLPAVAGVLVSNEKDLVFASNRGEKTVGVFPHGRERNLEKVKVGGFPNGLAFDPSRDTLLAANVSKQDDPTPITLSIVETKKRILATDIIVPGRTRWTVFNNKTDRFYVNISKPPQIVAVNSRDPDGIAATYEIPATGPHGLDIDVEGRKLFCACDQGGLFTVDLKSGRVARISDLNGPPDVMFYNSKLHHLYVAIGEPGVIDIFSTDTMKLVQSVKTEPGAHTIAYNPETDKIYAFLPAGHRAAVYQDR